MTETVVAIERETMRKVMVRLIPLLVLSYLFCYIDRVNVGFAALEMNRELGFSATVYGFGAGIFFLSYFACEVPSNLMLHRFGARLWLARIMVTWGILSGAMAFIPQIASSTGLSNDTVFYVLRFLLGAAEAGFSPGVLFFLTLWCPRAYRARAIGYFMTALPLAGVVGSPLSGAILATGGVGGFSGWQTMFLFEAVPSLVLTGVLLLFLTDRPDDAGWLLPQEREWLRTRLEQERQQTAESESHGLWRTIANPVVLSLGFLYFGVVAMNYTLGFFLPLIIKDFGLSSLQIGFVAAIPAAVGAAAMVVWGRRSDRVGERKWHLVFAVGVAVVSFGSAALTQDPLLKMICFTVAAFGIYGCQPVFWTLPGYVLSGASAAAGVAAINSLANISGFLGPYVFGWIKTSTGGYDGGLLLVAAVAGVALAVALTVGRRCFPSATLSGGRPPELARG